MLAILTAVALTSQAPTCSPALAKKVTISEVGNNLANYMGRCVTVEGAANGTALYAGVTGFYKTSLGYTSDLNDRDEDKVEREGRIGLYSRDGIIRAVPVGILGPAHMQVTGRVGSCERMYSEAEASVEEDQKKGIDSIVFLSGYCHYHGGAFVEVTFATLDLTRRYERLLGEENRVKYGRLDIMPANWPKRAEFAVAMNAFRAAVAAKNKEALLKLHGSDSVTGYQSEAVESLLREDSPFAQAASNPNLPVEFFVQDDVSKPEKASTFAIVCFCRTADCRDKWPISTEDSYNVWGRPYACTQVWIEASKGPWIFATKFQEGGLAEPHATLFESP